MANLVAAGSVNQQGQVVLDMDVVRTALMAPQPGQGRGGVDALAAIGDGLQLVASGIRVERLRSLETRVNQKRAAVTEAQTLASAAIANAIDRNVPAGTVLDPSDPVSSLMIALQALQASSVAQQDLARSQQLLDQCQDEEAAWSAGSAAIKLADDLGAGSGGMGGMGGGSGVGTAALVGGLAGGAAGLLTSGAGRSRR